MKAAYISYARSGGPLVHTEEFVRAFREFVPDLVTHTPCKNVTAGPKRDSRETFLNRVFAHLPGGLRKLKLEFYQIRKLLRDLVRYRRFASLYRENGVDIVIIRNDAFLSGAVAGARAEKIPYVLETNGILSKDYPDRVARAYEKYILSRAAGITAVCEPLADMLVDVGARREDILTVPNGVRPEVFESPEYDAVPADLRRILEGKIVAGYFGTFAPYHDLETLILAFTDALAECPELRLLFVGEGWRDIKAVGLIENSGVKDMVIFTGRVPHEEIPAYMGLCHVLINPLRRLYEEGFHGVPIKLLEYMAAGRPIISTRMPNLKEVLGPAALFVEEGSVEGWTSALLRLASDSTLRQEIGRAGPEQLHKRGYTWRENSRRVFDFCRQILQKEKNGR